MCALRFFIPFHASLQCAKAVFTLQCAMDRNEYNRICQCKSTKEIWRLLEITHERTNQVKESKLIYLFITMNCFQ